MGAHGTEVDYQRALELELKARGPEYEREVEVPIAYDGKVVAERRVDFLIWDEKDELLAAKWVRLVESYFGAGHLAPAAWQG